MDSFSPPTFRLPDLYETFSVLPDNGENPHHKEVSPQSRAWINQYTEVVCGPKACKFMDNCTFERCMSFFYPYASPAGLRVVMDLANILWLYDEYTDTNSGAQAGQAAHIVDRALHEQDYNDGTWICQMMRDFKRDHIKNCGPNVARRFIDNFCRYARTTSQEAHLREHDKVLDIPTYVCLRREASGVKPCFDLAEYCLGIDLPQYVYEDPLFISGYNASLDLVFWANDLFSYDMERAKGHANANIVTVIMKSKKVDLQSAVDFLGGYCEALVTNFLIAKNELASRSDPVFSKDAIRMLEALGDCVMGNVHWSFATERYFGKKKEIVKDTGILEVREMFVDIVSLEE